MQRRRPRPLHPRLSQAHHDRRRPGQRAAQATSRSARSSSGAPLVVLGGPAMLIGLGGGAASSIGSGQSSSDLDFASVQRGNPEIQRRAQEVIDRCWALGDAQSDPVDPRRRRRRPVQRAAGGDRAHAGAAAASTCARSRAPRPACRRWRSGATRRRSATCWRSRRAASSASRPCASASAVRSPWSARSPATDASRVTDPLLRDYAGRHADRGAARQAAADDPRGHAASPKPQPALSTDGARHRANRSSACCACRRWPTRPS